ncbi:MAG: hypothetical protein E3K32_13150 [wastewater metagenome]|nr:hypothetical protein [Candidatus Loosdrechtia aerotolerans]
MLYVNDDGKKQAAPPELDIDVNSCSITIPLLTELFRFFQKVKVLQLIVFIGRGAGNDDE